MAKFYCKCWKNSKEVPGFDVEAYVKTQVKIDKNGKYQYIYHDKDHNDPCKSINLELIQLVEIPRCGSCGDYAEVKENVTDSRLKEIEEKLDLLRLSRDELEKEILKLRKLLKKQCQS